MNDNLNFGIHFDLEKGLKDAQADWAKVEKELQTMIGNKKFQCRWSFGYKRRRIYF